jgi:hypothetical protein
MLAIVSAVLVFAGFEIQRLDTRGLRQCGTGFGHILQTLVAPVHNACAEAAGSIHYLAPAMAVLGILGLIVAVAARSRTAL